MQLLKKKRPPIGGLSDGDAALHGTRRSSADHDPATPGPYSMQRDGNASQKRCSVIESRLTLPWCHTSGTDQALPDCFRRRTLRFVTKRAARHRKADSSFQI